MTEDEFAAKVGWEGGILDALEYGLKASDLANPLSDLGQAWQELEVRYRALKPYVRAVEKELPDVAW